MINPTINPDFAKINASGVKKLLYYNNSKSFYKIVIPFKTRIEVILRSIDNDRFESDIKTFRYISDRLWGNKD